MQFGPEHEVPVILELLESSNARLCQSISGQEGAEALTTVAECLQTGLTPVFLTSKAPSVALYKVFN